MVRAITKLSAPLYMQLTCWYAPSYGWGGPIRLMADYAEWAMDSGLRVAVLTGDIHDDYTRVPKDAEHPLKSVISRYRVLVASLARRAIYIFSPGYFFDAFMLVVKTPGCTIIHTSDLRGVLPLLACALKMLFPRKVRLVHSAFGMLHHKKSRLRERYDRFFMGIQMRLLDIALVQNDHEKKVYGDLIARHGGHAHVELLPLHGDRSTEQKGRFIEEDAAALRKDYGIAEETEILLFLGRFHPEKGLIRTLNLLREIRLRGVDAVLFIVGRDHGFLDAMRAHIVTCGLSSYVFIVMNVNQRRFSYYKMADVFLGFPTIVEETMLSSVEALGQGTPVLLSREADMPYVENEGAGFVIDFDMDAAVVLLQEIITRKTEFSDKAFEVANRYYSPASIQKLFFESVVAQMKVNVEKVAK